MKLLALLFSFYITWLTVKPCSDHFITEAKAKTEMAAHAKTNSSHTDEEACSPLCSCSCCNTSFVIDSSQSPSTNLSYSVNNHPPSLRMVGDIYFSFWQPPKVS